MLKEFVTNILGENKDGICSAAMSCDMDETEFDNAGITCKCVDNYDGEDQGSDYWSVYSFTKDNETVYVKFQGWYASHYGSEYQSWSFVEPKQKTVTVFE